MFGPSLADSYSKLAKSFRESRVPMFSESPVTKSSSPVILDFKKLNVVGIYRDYDENNIQVTVVDYILNDELWNNVFYLSNEEHNILCKEFHRSMNSGS